MAALGVNASTICAARRNKDIGPGDGTGSAHKVT